MAVGDSTRWGRRWRQAQAAAPKRPAWRRSASPTSARPAVLWDRASGGAAGAQARSCGRTAVPSDVCEAAQGRAAHAARDARAAPGSTIDPYFSATKVAWMLDHVPGAARARRARASSRSARSTASSCTGSPAASVHMTDAEQRVAHAGVASSSKRRLETTSCSPAASTCRARCCRRWRPSHRPVYGVDARRARSCPMACRSHGIAGDQQSALFGQACFEPSATPSARTARARSS